MTPKEAAAIIGCSPQHVRTLIRQGKIKARQVSMPGFGSAGYIYYISEKEAARVAAIPQSGGYPRGRKRRSV